MFLAKLAGSARCCGEEEVYGTGGPQGHEKVLVLLCW